MAAANVSLVIPAYNEEGRLTKAVDAAEHNLKAVSGGSFEVIIVEDGCTDRTPEIARRLAQEREYLTHLHAEHRLERGRALETAFERAAGSTVGYMDADLATDPVQLPELVRPVMEHDVDIAVGTRRGGDSVADRARLRQWASTGYNHSVQRLFRSQISDHQCGFKAMTSDVFNDLQPALRSTHWFWDTELLIRAQRRGYRIHEVPVTWTEQEDTTVQIVRDALHMSINMLDLYRELR